MQVPNIDNLEKLIKLGFIKKIKHPTENLYILSYTKKASREAVWNQHTLNLRGLIVDQNYFIKARPFKKFFEKQQLNKNVKIPYHLPYKVEDKLDGSLGILYWLNDNPFIATKSSFDSYQAIIANKILRKKYANSKNLNKKYTYLFEIISPENRNIIDYGSTEDLFLIGIIDTETGKELNYPNSFPKPTAFKLNISDENLNKRRITNEGYVIKFQNGFKLKFKGKKFKKDFEEYKKIKIIVYFIILNNYSIKMLKNRLNKNQYQYALYLYSKGKKLLKYIINHSQKAPIHKIPIFEKIYADYNNHKCTSFLKLEIFKRLFFTSQYFSNETPYDLSFLKKNDFSI